MGHPEALFLLFIYYDDASREGLFAPSDVIDTRSLEEVTASVRAEFGFWVILADDDEALPSLLGEIFSKEDFGVLSAANGRE